MGAYLNERTQLVSAATASASFTTDIAWRNYGYGSFQVVWSSLNASNSTFKLQSSLDGLNFNDITSSTVTLSSGSSSQVYRLRDIGEEIIRCRYDKGSSATVGTIDLWMIRKGHIG
jgi:hypothetical protein